MKKINLLLLLVVFTMASCLKDHDSAMQDGQKDGDRNDFDLFDQVTVNVQMAENARCLLYTSNPYVDGDMVGDPVMTAYAPFRKDIRIPKSVDKLYMYVNGELLTFPRGDISLSRDPKGGAPVVSRAEGDEVPGSETWVTLSDAFVTAVYEFYPEKQVNVEGEDLKISTDLIAPKGEKERITLPGGGTSIIEWDSTKVWLTYVGHGGSDFNGSLWFYLYEVDGDKKPITSLEDIEAGKVRVFNNAGPDSDKGRRVYLGKIPPGMRMGFKYQGNSTLDGKPFPKYSTPHYNNLAYGHMSEQNNATSGIIRIWKYGGKEYATLGMENRLPSESAWDGDFNDMICVVEADPLFVENILPPPVPDPATVKWAGYWLFEDNYPSEGDYDFNDLVVKYAVTETEDKPTIIDLAFMARGASLNNSFGVNGHLYYENLRGYQNVFADREKVDSVMHQITVPVADDYIPMMNNGMASFDLNSYYENQEDFPCVMEIPIVDGSRFLWCFEKVRIDAAYPRYKDWVRSGCTTDVDWYKDTPLAGTVWDK